MFDCFGGELILASFWRIRLVKSLHLKLIPGHAVAVAPQLLVAGVRPTAAAEARRLSVDVDEVETTQRRKRRAEADLD